MAILHCVEAMNVAGKSTQQRAVCGLPLRICFLLERFLTAVTSLICRMKPVFPCQVLNPSIKWTWHSARNDKRFAFCCHSLFNWSWQRQQLDSTERERARESEREREREKARKRESAKERERERQRKREQERESERERGKERARERAKERKRERARLDESSCGHQWNPSDKW